MFVSKRKYEELEKRLRDAENNLLASESVREEVEKKLKKYMSKEHECDAMCEGCKHLIVGTELYFSPAIYGGMSHVPRKMTTKRCALDRTCKDYIAKETEQG